MRVLYVDDSGSRNLKGPDPYFCLAGFSVDADHLKQLAARLNNLKRKYGLQALPLDEVKFNEIGRNFDSERRPNPLMRAGHDLDARVRFGKELLEMLTRIPSVRAYLVAIRLDKLRDQESPIEWAVQLLCERFQYSMSDEKPQAVGIVICDEEEHHYKDMRAAVGQGTAFSQFNRLGETLLFAPSHLSAGVQLADFVAGAGGRWWNHQDDKYLTVLGDVLGRTKDGRIAGAGLKCFPSGDYPAWVSSP